MVIVDTVLLVVIMVVLMGILSAVKVGFNEVIKGLEAIQGAHEK